MCLSPKCPPNTALTNAGFTSFFLFFCDLAKITPTYFQELSEESFRKCRFTVSHPGPYIVGKQNVTSTTYSLHLLGRREDDTDTHSHMLKHTVIGRKRRKRGGGPSGAQLRSNSIGSLWRLHVCRVVWRLADWVWRSSTCRLSLVVGRRSSRLGRVGWWVLRWIRRNWHPRLDRHRLVALVHGPRVTRWHTLLLWVCRVDHSSRRGCHHRSGPSAHLVQTAAGTR